MWRRVSNGDSAKPEVLETATSERWNYVRKEFTFIEAKEDVPAHWEYDENKVLKEDWETYMQVSDHNTALDDVYAALTELADMILEG